MKGKLVLIGAGPGDPELITVKGANAIKSADVILYDALVNPSLLDYNSSAEKIYVGKRGGEDYIKQDAINEIIVSQVESGKNVVRLKGGDSFVFGRGHEEMELIEDKGLAVEVIPGISSVLAAPESQKVPLTRRGMNESFWVLTAVDRFGEIPEDMKLAAKSSSTKVILMGMKKLPQIVKIFMEEGKAEKAIMIVQNATKENEKVVTGRIQNILEQVEKEGIKSPAAIVIGDVVELHKGMSYEYAVRNYEDAHYIN